MEIKIDLIRGVNAFSKLDLIEKAAEYKGLKFQKGAIYSEPIKVYFLNERLLSILAERKIKLQARPDCHYEILTLVDENPQEEIGGWQPSNGWNFKLLDSAKQEFDLRIILRVGFALNIEERGIVFSAAAHSNFLSPADRLPNFRMFKALVENDNEPLLIARELVKGDGNIIVTWTDLSLGGIRKISDLFEEFAGKNEAVAWLGRNGNIFNPSPSPHHYQPVNNLLVAEPIQPKIIQTWRAQLKDYRARLAI